MTLSTDVLKGFDKIQYPFMIKTLKKPGVKGIFLNIIRAICDKPIANIILNGEKLTIPGKVKNETGMLTFSIPIQYSFGIPSQNNKTKAINKWIQIGKVEFKLSLFVDDMMCSLKTLKILPKTIRNHKLF
jgi:hypothetical protein